MNLSIAGRVSVVKQAVTAMPVIFPAGVIDDRVKAETVDGNVELVSGYDFVTDVVEPVCASVALGSSFRDEKRPSITIPDLFENFVKGPVGRIVARKCFRVVDPLVAVVEIDADDIQVLGFAAEFGSDSAGEHVPSLKLSETIFLGFGIIARNGWIPDDVNDRLGRDESYPIQLIEQHFAGRYRSAQKIALQLRTSSS